MEDLQRIRRVTNEFRKQQDELWLGVGRRLSERGIDIGGVIIADSFSEDVAQYYVVILTGKREVFEFYYDFLHKDTSGGRIIEWKDFTHNPKEVYMHESVETALKHFDVI
jgi:hypothetical protein